MFTKCILSFWAQVMFRRMDTDGSGSINLREFLADVDVRSTDLLRRHMERCASGVCVCGGGGVGCGSGGVCVCVFECVCVGGGGVDSPT